MFYPLIECTLTLCLFTYVPVAPLHHVVLPTSMCRPFIYSVIGLHSAIQCFMEFKHDHDLWMELNMMLTLGGIC